MHLNLKKIFKKKKALLSRLYCYLR